MTHNTFGEFVSKKAFEISYALFRISTSLGQKQFIEHLEDQAMRLLESAISTDYPKTRNILSIIEYFMRLGADTNIIHPATAELVINETKVLDSAIAEFGDSAMLPNVDLKGVFSQENFIPELNNENIKPADAVKTGKYEDVIPIKPAGENQDVLTMITPQNSAMVAEYAGKMRKEAILGKIRQVETCKLRDLQEFLPDLSERTIRYTLQTLVEQGVIERVGSTGPATYYRAKGEFQTDSQQELSTSL